MKKIGSKTESEVNSKRSERNKMGERIRIDRGWGREGKDGEGGRRTGKKGQGEEGGGRRGKTGRGWEKVGKERKGRGERRVTSQGRERTKPKERRGELEMRKDAQERRRRKPGGAERNPEPGNVNKL